MLIVGGSSVNETLRHDNVTTYNEILKPVFLIFDHVTCPAYHLRTNYKWECVLFYR